MSDKPAVEIQDVDDVTLAFPAGVMHLLPAWDDIPDQFKEHHGTFWNDVVNRWFFQGLPEDTDFKPKDGVDASKALRHVSACMKSFEPSHEHKEAGCAYLLSEWFEDIQIPDAKGAS